MINYLVIYTNSTTQAGLGESRPVGGGGEARPGPTARHPTRPSPHFILCLVSLSLDHPLS